MQRSKWGRAFAGGVALLLSIAGPAWARCEEAWLPGDGASGVNGAAYVAVVYDDGSGSAMYVGGRFTVAGREMASYIARWNGAEWQPVGSGFNGVVRALTIYEGQLIAGGLFTSSGGTEVRGVARWDGSSWRALGAGMDGPDGPAVYALSEYDGQLIAGGNFTSADGLSASHIARWHHGTWLPMGAGMGAVYRGDNAGVRALLRYNGELVAAGYFTLAGGGLANCIARWNGTSWSALGTGLTAHSTLPFVTALTIYNGELIAGGNFTKAGGISANRVAGWNGSQWRALGGGLTWTPNAVAVYRGELIAAGMSSFPPGQDTSANLVARWTGSAWKTMSEGLLGPVQTIAVFDDELIVGGGFSISGSDPAVGVAQWEDPQWVRLGEPGTSGPILTLLEHQGDLIAGGAFTEIAGVSANRVARWDGAAWTALGGGMNGAVNDLAAHGEDLIAGGQFSIAEDWGVARWRQTTWEAVGDTGSVSALGVYNGELYCGVWWYNILPKYYQFFAKIDRWNGSAWVTIAPFLFSQVEAFAVHDRALIAAYGLSVARWDGSAWQALGGGMNGRVLALAVDRGDLIAGGDFTTAGGVSASRIARWDGSSWWPLGVGLNGSVSALAIHRGQLIVGGSFTAAGGAPASRIARWNGSSWESLGAGLDGTVNTLISFNGELIAGGSFGVAGDAVSVFWARWRSPCSPEARDLDGDGQVSSLDLELLLGAWGPCPAPSAPCPADLDLNGVVNGLDLAILLGAWG